MTKQTAGRTDILLPQLAESLVSATIGKWLKKPGDPVEQYEPICELITDKVNAELPSTVEGTMLEIIAQEGETVPVGSVVCVISTADATAAAGGVGNEGEPAPSSATAVDTASNGAAGASAGRPAPGAASVVTDENAPMRGRYSPAVQQLAQQYGLDLTRIAGTGLGGRITRKDVLQAVEHGLPPAAVQAPIVQQATFAAGTGDFARAPLSVRTTGLHLSETPAIPKVEVEGQSLGGRNEYILDVTPIRNTIATRMRQSVAEIPHAWTMIEVDVTNLVLLRNKLKDEFKKQEGVNLTYLAFVLKAVVNAIKDYPIMNSVWAVDKIIVKRDINISLAVGTEDSVITPVIKKADQKNIAGLAREIEELSRKARAGKLMLDDIQGGTITVNNTGSFGSILSYPIINYPQAANLTFETIVKRPVVIQDMIAVRSMANMCLSLDHRILDGVICGRFLQRVKENLEGFTLDTKLY
ncbi:dihydrolipoamide acetyltransferase family protein [Paenibacillus koleovorans]|uniref:dihydrolipoamide acetyltransferase family protein n=1 Tax=Paenibacillus koleovorans TaxID=121608 RepID=UPI000FD7C2D8|nr:dihydrolipoamide acetyltransferase family protein [Paenibacillus koleovorans]